MPSKKLFLVNAVLFVSVSLLLVGFVGASSEVWSQTYGGTADDYAEAMVQTSDGGYALAGYTRSFGAGSYDFWLVKTNEYGAIEWNQTYGGTGVERAFVLVETSDGGYALAGYMSIFSPATGITSEFLLVKTDEYGNTEWNKTYARSNVAKAYAVVEASDGGYAIAGGGPLVKTDEYGNMEWNQSIGGVVHSLVATSDGGYALAGGINGDFWLAKADEHGVIPEFPSWIILPLFLTAALTAIIYRRKLTKK